MSGIVERDLPYDKAVELAECVLWNQGKFQMKKVEGGYEVYCNRCLTHEVVPAALIKEVKASYICPFCHNHIEIGKKTEDGYFEYVQDGKLGYRLDFDWSMERGISNIRSIQVGYFPEGYKHEYVRYIVKNFGYSIVWQDYKPKWRETYNRNYWSSNYKDLMMFKFERNRRTRREYYEKELERLPLKTNQVYEIKHHLINKNQALFMILFNINKVSDLLKYSAYIRHTHCEEAYLQYRFTLTTLEYLAKNHIELNDYIDYYIECRELGLKPVKADDFQREHMRVHNIWKKYKDEIVAKRYEAGVKKRREELKENEFEYKEMNIRVFESPERIKETGKTLKNCIYSYLERYSNGETDIFYMTEGEAIVGAIEVNGNKVRQARGYCNKDLTSEYKKCVTNWANKMNYQYA